jgi:stage II sporulation protein B
VDKPNKNTITIKVNGEKQPFIDEAKVKNSETNNGPFSTVIKIDPEYIEQNSFMEAAAAQEPVEESFDWIIPETDEDDIDEYKVASGHNSKKHHKSSFSKNQKKSGRAIGSIVISGIFAIVIGTTFGFAMLNLVNNDTSNKTTTIPKVVEQKGPDKAVTKTTTTIVKPFNTFIVQEGFYSSKESAIQAANQVSTIGIPAQPIAMNGKEYVYLGVADSLETAKKLGGLYKEKGVKDFFAKQISVGEKKFPNIIENEKLFLEAAPSIYQSLAKMTASAIILNTITEDFTKQIDEQLKVKGFKNETILKLKTELSTAEDKLKAFQTSKDAKSISEAQQHLLNFLSLYNSL